MDPLKSRLLRWQQMSRYYLNKWQYDGSKFVDRVWRGAGTGAADKKAQVPFMITKSMRQQLQASGYPSDEISRMLPKLAHQLIADKVSYSQFEQQKQREIEELAAAAKEAIAQEEKAAQDQSAAASSIVVVAETHSSSRSDESQERQATKAMPVSVVIREDQPDKQV